MACDGGTARPTSLPGFFRRPNSDPDCAEPEKPALKWGLRRFARHRLCDRVECVEEVAEVLRQPAEVRPTAILVSNDFYAVAVYEAARALGLEIGRDLSVVGFSDVALASLPVPKLTTVRQDAIQIGRNAAELLLDRIERRVENVEPQAVQVGCDLVVRSSTGPEPA